jgi:hypothetical protein
VTPLRGGSRSFHPADLAWHPAVLAALVLLVANDYVLKPWGGVPWLSGKLSDVAGLFLLPLAFFVLASLLTKRRLGLAGLAGLVAVGVCFALVKTWPAFNGLYSSCVARLLGGIGLDTALSIRVDPTDLLALPALGASWWLMRGALPGGRYATRS